MPNLPELVEFSQVDKSDVALVGGKGANLGEMARADLPVPPGFIVTSQAYYRVLDINQLKPQIQSILKKLDIHKTKQLNRAASQIKKLIVQAKVPDDLAQKIIKAYLKLGRGLTQALVAVRSSATAEDLPDASFAGQQRTFLNVSGEANLVQKVRACWASLFEPRAIFYRQEKGFDHFKVGIAVPVQKMIQSQVSGVMFTINPVTNDKTQIVIEAIWGLGEKIVQGAYTPDHYLVLKKEWKLLQEQLNPQTHQYILKHGRNQEVKLPKSKIKRRKLNKKQIISLAKLGEKIHQHYFFPQDIEWALEKNRFYIVQTRPVTTLSPRPMPEFSTQQLKLRLKGEPASPGTVSGYVRVLASAKEIDSLKPGEILVTDMTSPDFVPAMKKAAAIITNQGGQTSHAAIVSRELGVPCVVGTEIATTALKTGQVITVKGQTGEIFLGAATKKSKKLKLTRTKKSAKSKDEPGYLKTVTKIYVNLGEPDLAELTAQKNVDGVGLLRAEFMIAQLGVHPKKLIQEKKSQSFIDQLAQGLTTFAKAFNPRPVVYRATDFKTNEYANLIGGKAFEPVEPNPMLGYRGAFRYINDPRVFELELEAIKRVRNRLGYKNLWLMLPFVRTLEELSQAKKLIAAQGLVRSASFQLWMMVEIPANVLLLEDFIKLGIDGISIGTNDLTMLILGVDRDNSEVAPIYDERNPAVLKALETIITTCRRKKISSSICGQAPSVYPDLTEKLVKWGISSISVSPDVIETTRQIVYQAEQKKLHGSHSKH
jgi:pyruvate,water dikinase